MEELLQETNTDSARKLASIQVISNISKHPNADKLALANVLGWQVVIRGDGHEDGAEANVGDVVIYCEIDSKLPLGAAWIPEAVAARFKNEEWFRVKTIKLRKELSQGLIIPITKNLPEELWGVGTESVGMDVTKLLGIKKYEPLALSGKYAMRRTSDEKSFPSHLLSKTDESRIQSSPWLLDKLAGLPFYATVKLDGTSATYVIDPDSGEFLVCSRNLIRSRPENLSICPYWYIAERYDIEKKLRSAENANFAFQGEICGPNVQKNLLNLKDLHYFVFNVVNISTGIRLPYCDMRKICETLELDIAPLEYSDDKFATRNIPALLKWSEGSYSKKAKCLCKCRWGNAQREGLVFRSTDQKISFKVINNRYLSRK